MSNILRLDDVPHDVLQQILANGQQPNATDEQKVTAYAFRRLLIENSSIISDAILLLETYANTSVERVIKELNKLKTLQGYLSNVKEGITLASQDLLQLTEYLFEQRKGYLSDLVKTHPKEVVDDLLPMSVSSEEPALEVEGMNPDGTLESSEPESAPAPTTDDTSQLTSAHKAEQAYRRRALKRYADKLQQASLKYYKDIALSLKGDLEKFLEENASSVFQAPMGGKKQASLTEAIIQNTQAQTLSSTNANTTTSAVGDYADRVNKALEFVSDQSKYTLDKQDALRKVQQEAVRLFGSDDKKKSKFIRNSLDNLIKQQTASNAWLHKISKTKAGSFLSSLLGGTGGTGGIARVLNMITKGGMGGTMLKSLLGGMGLGSLAAMGTMALRALPIIGGGISMYSGLTSLAERNDTNPNAGFTEGGWNSRAADYGKSALGGAAIGATIGSIVPGVGTVIGGVVGGAVGTLAALYADNKNEVDAFIQEHKQTILGLGSAIMKGPLGVILYSLEKALSFLNITYDKKNRNAENAPTSVVGEGNAGSLTFTGGGSTGGATSALAMSIGKGESGQNYNVYNGGIGNDYKRGETDFSKMTAGQVKARQNLRLEDPNRIFAFGRYQMVPDTFHAGLKAIGANDNTMVTPELQDEIFLKYLTASKRPDIKKFVTGEINDVGRAINSMAAEWAAIQMTNGRGRYDGKGNKATITPQESSASLTKARSDYAAYIKSGLSPDDAYRKAVLGNVGPQTQEEKNKTAVAAVQSAPQLMTRMHDSMKKSEAKKVEHAKTISAVQSAPQLLQRTHKAISETQEHKDETAKKVKEVEKERKRLEALSKRTISNTVVSDKAHSTFDNTQSITLKGLSQSSNDVFTKQVKSSSDMRKVYQDGRTVLNRTSDVAHEQKQEYNPLADSWVGRMLGKHSAGTSYEKTIQGIISSPNSVLSPSPVGVNQPINSEPITLKNVFGFGSNTHSESRPLSIKNIFGLGGSDATPKATVKSLFGIGDGSNRSKVNAGDSGGRNTTQTLGRGLTNTVTQFIGRKFGLTNVVKSDDVKESLPNLTPTKSVQEIDAKQNMSAPPAMGRLKGTLDTIPFTVDDEMLLAMNVRGVI